MTDKRKQRIKALAKEKGISRRGAANLIAQQTEAKRMEYRDIPPELAQLASDNMANYMCKEMGIPRERLKNVRHFDPLLEGRTGVHFEFEPDLNEEETERMKQIALDISKKLGGRPPIFPPKV